MEDVVLPPCIRRYEDSDDDEELAWLTQPQQQPDVVCRVSACSSSTPPRPPGHRVLESLQMDGVWWWVVLVVEDRRWGTVGLCTVLVETNGKLYINSICRGPSTRDA